MSENPEKGVMLKRIQELRAEKESTGKNLYYENQSATGDEIMKSIRTVGVVFQMVVAVCQAGKTGCMVATIEKLLLSDINVDPAKIFVVTGLSDKEWVTQTKCRLPFLENENVIHRGQFRRSIHLLENLENAVIFIDECQTACKEDMSVDKLLRESGLKNLEYLKDHNINIVELSATPNSTLNDIELWKTCSKTIVMEPGQHYKGHSALLERDRIFQACDLFIAEDPEGGLSYDEKNERIQLIEPAYEAIRNLRDMIAAKYTDPRFHIIRTPNGTKSDTVFRRVERIFGDTCVFKKCYNGEDQLIVQLHKIPTKHTFLFIKEKARCAVTFPHKHQIGALYERIPKNPMDDVIVQGLAGRACGYDVDDKTIVFTEIESIRRYIVMAKSGFSERDDFTFTGYKSHKKSHIHPTKYRNAKGETHLEVLQDTEVESVTIKKCKTVEEAREYIRETEFKNKKPGARGPNPASWEKKKNEKGFYESTSGKAADKTKVRTTHEIEAIRNWGLNNTHGYTFHPCYEDINDKSTLQWWVIHR